MAGSSNITGLESIIFADNASFDGTERGGAFTTNGQLWIGSTALPHVVKGTLTSPSGTITIGFATPNITLDVAASAVVVEKFAMQSGTTPVVPAAGIVTFNGMAVNAGTNPVLTNGTGANTMTLQVQRSQAIAAADSTKVGLAAFDSAKFTVDVNGFVSLSGSAVPSTITGDSGGALSPTAGNWNILGRSGSKTSGAASTLTIKSPPFADQGGSTTVTLNSGAFVTAAITLTLPASAGLADGDLFEFVCTTAGALIVQAVGAQKIRIGTLLSSAAGTATSTNIGDSLVLRFRATDGFFYAVGSPVGVWLIA